MASVGDAGLSRITLVAPRTRIDLALPSDVPLADLLPTLLHYAGGEAAGDGAGAGWALSRLGGMALDSSRTPSQLEVRDGELLYLRPRGGEAPMLVFDDVVDAVATATNDRADRWRPATTRTFGLALGVIALLGGAAVLLFTGPPQGLPGLIGARIRADHAGDRRDPVACRGRQRRRCRGGRGGDGLRRDRRSADQRGRSVADRRWPARMSCWP